MKKGFTIVELLVVIAILGILLGIIMTAANGSIKSGRNRRADAMCSVLQQAIAAYYAQEGEWPGAIKSLAQNGISGNKTTYQLKPSEADQVFREIVKKSVGSGATTPLVDASALFVANANNLKNNQEGCYDNHSDRSCSSFCGDKGCATGVDFTTATQKNGKHRISVSNMAFGYQGPGTGRFCRFWITYNGQTDAVSVSRKSSEKTYPNN